MKITEESLHQKSKEAEKNPFIAYDIGEYYYSLGRYEEAVKWYEKAATGTPVVPLALYAMGYACQIGQGMPVDMIRAFQYYEAAAEEDVPQACYNLAYFYQNGIVVNRDLQKATRYSQKASECLKKITEEFQEPKGILFHDLLKEIVDYKEKIGRLESENKFQNVNIQDLCAVIDSQKKAIEQHEESYKELTTIHHDVLHTVDKLNDEMKQIHDDFHKKELFIVKSHGESEARFKKLSSILENQKQQIDILTDTLNKTKRMKNIFFGLFLGTVVVLGVALCKVFGLF